MDKRPSPAQLLALSAMMFAPSKVVPDRVLLDGEDVTPPTCQHSIRSVSRGVVRCVQCDAIRKGPGHWVGGRRVL